MKKLFVSLVLTLSIIGGLTPLPIEAETAAVTGKVQLNAKANGFPSNLEEIYAGHDTTITRGKKGKKISVEATYTGESKLRVTEVGEFADSAERYLFDIPVPTVMQTFAKKATVKKRRGLVQAIFSSLDELSDGDSGDSESSGDNFSSLSRTVKVAKKKHKKRAKTVAASAGQAISVVKLVATRKGNKGILKGTFASDGAKAKGRFALKFTFEE